MQAVPISLGVILISLALAFMPWVRGAIYWVSTVTWAGLSEYTGLRWIWLKIISYRENDNEKIKYHSSEALFASQRRTVSTITSRRERNNMRQQLEKAKMIDERKGCTENGGKGSLDV
jgi:hypothetical protein